MPEKLPISVVVHTKNAAQTLTACLNSLPPVTEILVVDMESIDETLLIARRFHARTMTVADTGFVEPARQVAIAAATEDWILILDADETLPEAAKIWLPPLLEIQDQAVYALPRKNIIFNRALEHSGWWPDYQVRLFRKWAVNWPTNIHAQPNCAQKPVKLPATDNYAIVHENYQKIGQFIDRMNHYTTIEAQQKPQLGVTDWLTLTSNEFFARFGEKQGWRDQEQGLAVSLLQSFYPLVTALKRWEQLNFPSSENIEQSIGRQLDKATSDLAYWRANYHMAHTHGLLRFYWQFRRKLQM